MAENLLMPQYIAESAIKTGSNVIRGSRVVARKESSLARKRAFHDMKESIP